MKVDLKEVNHCLKGMCTSMPIVAPAQWGGDRCSSRGKQVQKINVCAS